MLFKRGVPVLVSSMDRLVYDRRSARGLKGLGTPIRDIVRRYSAFALIASDTISYYFMHFHASFHRFVKHPVPPRGETRDGTEME